MKITFCNLRLELVSLVVHEFAAVESVQIVGLYACDKEVQLSVERLLHRKVDVFDRFEDALKCADSLFVARDLQSVKQLALAVAANKNVLYEFPYFSDIDELKSLMDLIIANWMSGKTFMLWSPLALFAAVNDERKLFSEFAKEYGGLCGVMVNCCATDKTKKQNTKQLLNDFTSAMELLFLWLGDGSVVGNDISYREHGYFVTARFITPDANAGLAVDAFYDTSLLPSEFKIKLFFNQGFSYECEYQDIMSNISKAKSQAVVNKFLDNTYRYQKGETGLNTFSAVWFTLMKQ